MRVMTVLYKKNTSKLEYYEVLLERFEIKNTELSNNPFSRKAHPSNKLGGKKRKIYHTNRKNPASKVYAENWQREDNLSTPS